MSVFRGYAQEELDRQYDQGKWSVSPPKFYEQLYRELSGQARAKLAPQEFAYGPSEAERLDVYRAAGATSPILVFLHGGAWRALDRGASAFAAEFMVSRGVCYVAIDFGLMPDVTMPVLVDQVRRGIVWVRENCQEFGGDPNRIHICGHSSGAHLTACAAVTDWPAAYGMPTDLLKSAICISGAYDLAPVQKSARNAYMSLTDDMVVAYSANRHLANLGCPLVLAVADKDSDEFRRQSAEFAQAAGVPLHVEPNSDHFQISFTLGDPNSHLAKAVLAKIFGETAPAF
jgi:arylformamidase